MPFQLSFAMNGSMLASYEDGVEQPGETYHQYVRGK
jgi:hypothetical protein